MPPTVSEPRAEAHALSPVPLPNAHLTLLARAVTVVKALTAQGHTVRGTVRDLSATGKHVESLGAKAVEVKDMSDATALEAAFAGVDGVFHMAVVHPEYGFAKTPEGRDAILKTAVGERAARRS